MKSIPSPGIKIAIPNTVLHLSRSGPKSDISILVEAGATCCSPHYAHLQQEIAKFMQVYTYDRAGLGWSDLSNNPRDAESIALELFQLLEASNINAPLILVGHSAACFYLRVFAHKYPQWVAAIVLLDPSHPKQESILDSRAYTPAVKRVQRKAQWLARLNLIGFYSPVFKLDNPKISTLPESAKTQLTWIYKQLKTYITSEAEYAQFSNSAKQALSKPKFNDLPLKVITGPADMVDPVQHQHWMDLQADIAGWSSIGEHIVFKDAGHMTLFTDKKNAKKVADEVLIFCQKHGFVT